jgi:hypothetical protein
MEKISWTDRVNNEVILQKAKEERNILHDEGRPMDWAHIA